MLEKISAAVSDRDLGSETVSQRNPLNLLILGGILLIAAIAIGTSFTIISFRQRALLNSERELQNTVLLLARHFDRELENLDAIQRDFVRRVQETGIRTPEAFDQQMSGEEAHNALKIFVSASPATARFNVFDANGQLINSSVSWPIPAINIADRDYFKQFKADPQSPDAVIAPVRSRFVGGWTTVVARKITAPDGTNANSLAERANAAPVAPAAPDVAATDDNRPQQWQHIALPKSRHLDRSFTGQNEHLQT